MSSSMEAPVLRDHSDRVEDVSPQMSQWFLSKFQGFDNFLETSVEGLEKVATSFLLAVEAKMKQREFEFFAQKKKIQGGGRGLQELQSLFSSVNYDFSSVRPCSVSRERALIVSK